jgi:hypothetical protein
MRVPFPLASVWPMFGELDSFWQTVSSPGGAAVGSQGCQPIGIDTSAGRPQMLCFCPLRPTTSGPVGTCVDTNGCQPLEPVTVLPHSAPEGRPNGGVCPFCRPSGALRVGRRQTPGVGTPGYRRPPLRGSIPFARQSLRRTAGKRSRPTLCTRDSSRGRGSTPLDEIIHRPL